MDEQAENALVALRRRLWAHVEQQPTELALAAQALFGRAPEPDELADLLDFAATEWIDAEGRTAVERLPGAPVETREWPTEIRDALWIVDGWDAELVLLRDIATDEEIAVFAPRFPAELTRRTVLRARLVPWAGGFRFFGEPALYGEQGVIGRQQLLAAWRDSPEPALLDGLRTARGAFAEQRDQRDAFVAYFGSDEVICPNADALEERLNSFLWHYHFELPLARLGGRTHAELHAANTGKSAQRVEVRFGHTVRDGGSPACVFDDVHGVQFWPSFGELRGHLRGDGIAWEVTQLYLSEPELPALALYRAGPTEAIADLLRIPVGEVEPALAALKPTGRASPSVLPGLSEAT